MSNAGNIIRGLHKVLIRTFYQYCNCNIVQLLFDYILTLKVLEWHHKNEVS